MSKPNSFLIAGVLFVTAYAAHSLAHDPKEHEAEPAKPDCTAMKDVDASEIDMKDPIAKAIYQKCQEAMAEERDDQKGGDDTHHADDDSSEDADHHGSH